MTNISFSTGTFKEYRLNGGESIRINIGDPGIAERLNSCDAKIDEISARYGKDITNENMVVIEKEIRTMIDDTLCCPGACDKAFGAVSCLALADGKPVCINFINAITAQIAKDMKDLVQREHINSSIRSQQADDPLDNERTRKYITQSPQTTEPVQGINLATLSQEERSRLLAELVGESK